jgi:hypothetical protein
MEQRPFPGAPGSFSLIFSKEFSSVAEKLIESGNERSRMLGETLGSLSVILLTPRPYFDLFMSIGEYYPALQRFWNDEVFAANGGKKGSGEIKMSKAEDVKGGIDMEAMTSDFDPQSFNVLMGTLQFTQDREQIEKISGDDQEMKEQMMIMNQIIWAIYMGVFNDEYFSRNHELFTRVGNEAETEVKELLKDMN